MSSPFSNWQDSVACCQSVVLGLRLFEVISIVSASVACLFFLVVMARAKVMHNNLRLALALSPVIDVLIGFARIPDIINLSASLAANWAAIAANSAAWLFTLVASLNVLLEKLWLLYKFPSYDASSSSYPTFTAILLLLEAVPIAAFTAAFVLGIINRRIFVCTTAAIVAVLISTFLFVQYSMRHRIRQVLERRIRLSESSVAKRREAVEAQRSFGLLKIFIPIFLISSIVFMSLAVVFLAEDTRYFPLLYQAQYSLVATRPFVYIFIILRFHPVLRRTTFNLALGLCRKSKVQPVPATMLSGQPPTMSTLNATDLYFFSLLAAWERPQGTISEE